MKIAARRKAITNYSVRGEASDIKEVKRHDRGELCEKQHVYWLRLPRSLVSFPLVPSAFPLLGVGRLELLPLDCN